MAVKKSDLYRSLWSSCDELRGGMDASQYKDYVLVILFVKYVTDRYRGQRDALVDVPAGGSFDDLLALRNKPNIGDGTNKVIAKLAEANDLRGVIDLADFNDPDKLGRGKEMVDRLTALFSIFDNPALNFGANNADGDDLLGDAYEYLMRHFATEAGKSKGQFYTPAEVSRILAAVVGVEGATRATQTIYDPTAGSGSLLLKAHKRAIEATGLDLAIYGQEMDNATAALAKMNMILHGVPTAEVWQDNTLSSPHFLDGRGGLKKFDFVVANPPFSNKSWTNGVSTDHDPFGRFEYGVPPDKNGDYAFLLHMLTSLKPEGKAAVILPHGVLFRGNAEAAIRTELVKRGLVKAVIGLPVNLFYGTGIPAAIVVLDKEGAESRTSIVMIDASKGFAKDGNKNRLRERDIHRVIDAFRNPQDVPGFSRVVPIAEVADPRNGYNLNLPRYIPPAADPDRQDLAAHVLGGLPNRDIDALSDYWKVAPTLRAALFEPADRPGYSILRVAPAQAAELIAADTDLADHAQAMRGLLVAWVAAVRPKLVSIDAQTKPSELVADLSESLLETFLGQSLLDGYALYQDLMTVWAASMRDDVEAVRSDGWLAAAMPVPVVDKEDKDPVDYTLGSGRGKQRYRSPVLPRAIVVERFCEAEGAALVLADEQVAAAQAEIDELAAEHGGEEGLLSEVVDEKGALVKTRVTTRAKVLRSTQDPELHEEKELVGRAVSAIAAVDVAKKSQKDAAAALETAVQAGYGGLSSDDARDLIVDVKWLTDVADFLEYELVRTHARLTDRVLTLYSRYEQTLPDLERDAGQHWERVSEHFHRLGISW